MTDTLWYVKSIFSMNSRVSVDSACGSWVNGLWVRIPPGSLVVSRRASNLLCSCAPKANQSQDLLRKKPNSGILTVCGDFKADVSFIFCMSLQLLAHIHIKYALVWKITSMWYVDTCNWFFNCQWKLSQTLFLCHINAGQYNPRPSSETDNALPPPATNYTITGLLPHREYEFQVLSQNDVNKAASSWVTARTLQTGECVCDLHVTYMCPTCDLHVAYMWPTCGLHMTGAHYETSIYSYSRLEFLLVYQKIPIIFIFY